MFAMKEYLEQYTSLERDLLSLSRRTRAHALAVCVYACRPFVELHYEGVYNTPDPLRTAYSDLWNDSVKLESFQQLDRFVEDHWTFNEEDEIPEEQEWAADAVYMTRDLLCYYVGRPDYLPETIFSNASFPSMNLDYKRSSGADHSGEWLRFMEEVVRAQPAPIEIRHDLMTESEQLGHSWVKAWTSTKK